jgi:hypothetical protein
MRIAVSLLGGVAVLSAGVSAAQAWGTGNCMALPLKVHATIAENVLNHASIAPYLTRFGLNRAQIVAKARIEPQCFMGSHPSWRQFLDQSYLSWPVSNQTIGAILHVAGDSGVASCHSPANEVWCNNTAENLLEANAELYSVPRFTEIYNQATFAQKLAAFRQEAIALANQYKAWWARKPWHCPPVCNTVSFGHQGQILGQKLGLAVLLHYFQMKAAAQPAPGR